MSIKEKYKKISTQYLLLNPPVTTITHNKNITEKMVMKYPRQ
jgi:hypothetical protein